MVDGSVSEVCGVVARRTIFSGVVVGWGSRFAEGTQRNKDSATVVTACAIVSDAVMRERGGRKPGNGVAALAVLRRG